MFHIEKILPDQWHVFKDLRIRALKDTPDSFSSSAEEEKLFEDKIWKERLDQKESATFVALTELSEPIGLVVGAPYDGEAGLFSMWVSKEWRQRGIATYLVHAVIEWARLEGYSKLLLDVGDENLPAIQLYRSQGFIKTGVVGSLPHPREHVKEHQLCLKLSL